MVASEECLLGAVSTSMACIFTNPLEVVKTRLQLQGELQSRGHYTIHYRGVLHAFYAIAEADGVPALQRGLIPALLYQVFLNGPRLGAYQVLENVGFTKDRKDGKIIFYRSVFAGAISGAFGAFVASPFYLAKTRLQARAAASVAVGFQHKQTNLAEALKDVYRKGGFLGLWAGVNAAVPRVMVGSAAQLTTFSAAKQRIDAAAIFPYPNHILCVFLSSCLSGLAVVVFMTPFDVISTRLYNQPSTGGSEKLYYKGFWDCAIKMRRTEGMLAFYKGWTASLLRSAPHTVLSLIFWDELRKAYFQFRNPADLLDSNS